MLENGVIKPNTLLGARKLAYGGYGFLYPKFFKISGKYKSNITKYLTSYYIYTLQ